MDISNTATIVNFTTISAVTNATPVIPEVVEMPLLLKRINVLGQK